MGLTGKITNAYMGLTGKITNAYAVRFDIQDSAKLLSFLNECEAEHKAEVAVIIDGEQKEFTFEDFKKRLGFGELKNDTKWKD